MIYYDGAYFRMNINLHWSTDHLFTSRLACLLSWVLLELCSWYIPYSLLFSGSDSVTCQSLVELRGRSEWAKVILCPLLAQVKMNAEIRQQHKTWADSRCWMRSWWCIKTTLWCVCVSEIMYQYCCMLAKRIGGGGLEALCWFLYLLVRIF